jgi:lipid-A-disaccharide synthase
LARDCDLLLSIIPFEKQWYARRTPKLRVEFVGHPSMDRHATVGTRSTASLNILDGPAGGFRDAVERVPTILLLPGSRVGELTRHLPVMLAALTTLRANIPGLGARMVLPNETLFQQAKSFGLPENLDVQAGGLPEALKGADVAIASTGTVMLECAFFGVPTVALYKASWTTYQVGKRIIKVKYLAMPNLLANEEVFPEFIQDAATSKNIARAALDLLRDNARRTRIKTRLAEIVATLGGPGASRRAAEAILKL